MRQPIRLAHNQSDNGTQIGKEPTKWFLKKKLSLWIAIAAAIGLLCTGIADLRGTWDASSWVVLSGLIVAVLAQVLQALVSSKRESEISELTVKVRTARTDGMRDAFAELRRGLHELNEINRSGWTLEKSTGFQTRLVDLTYRVLDAMGVPEARACFYTSLTSEVAPGSTTDSANVQVLKSFYHSGASSRRSPSEEHHRNSDPYKMFALLKDPRPDVIPRRKNVSVEHKGWRSAIRVGVIGIAGAGKSRKVAWGVLTADSTKEYAFDETSGVVLQLTADLIVLARTAETQLPDVRSLVKLRHRIDIAERSSQEKGG